MMALPVCTLCWLWSQLVLVSMSQDYGQALLDVGKMHILFGGFGSMSRPELCQLSIDPSVWYLPAGLGINLLGW